MPKAKSKYARAQDVVDLWPTLGVREIAKKLYIPIPLVVRIARVEGLKARSDDDTLEATVNKHGQEVAASTDNPEEHIVGPLPRKFTGPVTDCVWPYGEKKTFRYCGDPTLPGEPYCEHHWRCGHVLVRGH